MILKLLALAVAIGLSAGLACSCTGSGGSKPVLTTSFWPYAFSSGECTLDKQTDPITLQFTVHATGANVMNHAAEHTSGQWKYQADAFSQWFYDGTCHEKTSEVADKGALSLERYHMRFWSGASGGSQTALSTPHHETLSECTVWHGVDDNLRHPPGGYVMARTEIVNLWSATAPPGAPHAVGTLGMWGNTAAVKQCAGPLTRWAWSDGMILTIEVP